MSSVRLPFMSVVVIGYNSAKSIPRALDSILAQDYPKDSYEIIVVNDGSTDNMSDVVRSYPTVRLVELPTNKGIAAGRNAGLAVARGDVYVAFDSDCYARPNWLSQLARGYQLADPIGVSGRLIGVGGSRSILMRYIEASDSGIAAKKADSDGPKSLTQRLLGYLTSGLHRGEFDESKDHSEVNELYGANGSFPVAVLRAVGGWNESAAAPAIGGIEDRDLCFRIRQAYPKGHFYAMHHALIMHDPTITFKKYMLRPYRRGPFNYDFHSNNGMMPPIFPFPLLLAVLALFTTAFVPIVALLELALLPLGLYWAWVVRAIREKQWAYLTFPYLQLCEETMVLAGLFRGFLRHNKDTDAAN